MLKIVVEKSSTDDARVYQINRKISDYPITTFEHPPLTRSDERALNMVGSAGQRLVKLVAGIEGVDFFAVERHRLSVHIGAAYDWNLNGINGEILEILKFCFLKDGSKEDLVIETQQLKPSHIKNALQDALRELEAKRLEFEKNKGK